MSHRWQQPVRDDGPVPVPVPMPVQRVFGGEPDPAQHHMRVPARDH